MKWFLNLKIAAKLIISFVFIALIAGIVGAVGLYNLNSMNKADTQLYKENTLGVDRIGNTCISYQRIRFNSVKMMLVEENEIQDCIDKVNTFTADVEEYLQKYSETIFSQEERELYNQLEDGWDQYAKYIQIVVADVQKGDIAAAKSVLFGDAATTGDNLQNLFDTIMEYNSTSAEKKSGNNDRLATSSTAIMVVVIIAGVMIAIVLGVVISRVISNPINRLVTAADQLALGNVSISINSDTKDETGKLSESFSRMVSNIREQAKAAEKIADGDLTVEISVRSENDLLGKKLSEMVERNNEIMNSISAASEQVASGAKQISDSSIALSQGATEQASSIEQLTASLEEISAQTELNAKNANQANELAEIAKVNAIGGNTQMKDMQRAMEEINDSSANISKIIKVIDEIAFQTNILALNAAVEAARAGQQGKGFAVVAEEVRNLAARSANAAKETTELIEGSIKKVEAGTKLANETASALNKIVEDVSRAATLVNDIASASSEQASGIGQINQGIMQVSQVVQTNSATSEESAAASEELSSQATLLSSTVQKFKIKKSRNYDGRYDTIDPEVLRMLDRISEQRKYNVDPPEDKSTDNTSSKFKISLTDKDFGKY